MSSTPLQPAPSGVPSRSASAVSPARWPSVIASPCADTDLLDAFADRGIRDIVSVPCSITDTWHALAAARARRGDLRLTMTAHEGNLAGIAAGVWFATGRPALVHMQNSGLANAADGIVSFASREVFDVPMVAMVTYRGADDRETSEPHQAIGRRTDALVDAVFGPDAVVTGNRHGDHLANAAALAAEAALAGRLGVVKVAESGFVKLHRTESTSCPAADPERVADTTVAARTPSLAVDSSRRRSRDEAIRAIAAHHPDAALLFCNGYTARAAHALVGGPRVLPNVGYMGGTLAIGWSLARLRPDLEVVVVDGDQNALMSTMKDQLAAERPANLHWYVLDNGIGASVGTCESVPLGDRYDDLATVIRTTPDEPGSFAHPRVATDDGSPIASLAHRFRRWIETRTQGGLR